MEKPLQSYGKVLMPEKNRRKSVFKKPKINLGLHMNVSKKTYLLTIIKKALLILMGYLCGAFSVLGGFNPLGVACAAAFFSEGISFYFVLIAVFMGYVKAHVFGVHMYAIALCFASVMKVAIFDEKKKYGFYQGLMGALCLFVGGTVFSVMNQGSRFIFMRGILEGLCVFGLTEIFRQGIFLVKGDIRKKILGQEEILCLGTLCVFSLCVIAMGGVYGFEIAFGLSTMFLLMLSYKTGTQGVAIATVLGLLFILIQKGTKEFFLLICIATLMSGLFAKKRLYCVISFWIGYIVPAFYLEALPSKSMIMACLIGSCLFLMLPKKVIDIINTYEFHKQEFEYNDYFIRVKEILEERLKNFAQAFGALAVAFEVPEVDVDMNPSGVGELVDNVSKKVCNACEMYFYCWRAKNYETYEGIHRLIGAVEKKGQAQKEDFTPWINESCVLKRDLLESVNFYGQEYKNNLIWQKKLNQSQTLVKEQLICVQKILGDLGNCALPQPIFYESLSKEIRERLSKKKIIATKVYVTNQEKYGLRVVIKKEPCFGNSQCRETILFTVNQVLGKNLVLEKPVCATQGDCQLVFKEQKGYRLQTAVAAITKEGSDESGDTYYYDEICETKGILALSDGMGTGTEAAKESRKAVALIKKFLHAGFPLKLAMKTLNSVLALETREIYATMDICSVDLISGETEIVKNGGATVFVLKGEKIKTIRSSSLPVGVLPDWEGELTKVKVEQGDIIVMVTDGITESFGLDREKEAVIKSFEQGSESTEKLASNILKLALKERKGVASDDMTVLVAKVC